jgi:hypothetical protein
MTAATTHTENLALIDRVTGHASKQIVTINQMIREFERVLGKQPAKRKPAKKTKRAA